MNVVDRPVQDLICQRRGVGGGGPVLVLLSLLRRPAFFPSPSPLFVGSTSMSFLVKRNLHCDNYNDI